MKVKDDIVLNPRAHIFQASEQLHARSVNKKEDKLGDKGEGG